MGYNYVFSIGQGVDQMGKVLEKYDWGNNQKITKKRCVSFYHSVGSYFLKVVSTRRSKAIGEKEVSRPQKD